MKLIRCFLLALPALFISSCDHHDDLPDIDVNLTVTGCVVHDNTMYVLKEDGFEVVSATLENRSSKSAVIGSIVYLWDSARVGDSVTAPYSYNFNTSDTEAGPHLFQMEAAIYAVDYPPATASLSCDVVVVESTDDIPDGAGAFSDSYQLNASIKKGESHDNDDVSK